jgi:hypothetical protein
MEKDVTGIMLVDASANDESIIDAMMLFNQFHLYISE